ncbi:MAG: DUF6056 family protein [Erysipelotrichaceae bacterium]|nr:DUF6056 family protein [Erysipelotrichaceae bacterium]
MKIKELRTAQIFQAVLLFCFFAFFLILSRWAPVAGDDWGYALGGRWNNPFMKAVQFYFIWSGRFFSELWGFLIADRKYLWNLINPMIFTGILYYLIRAAGTKQHPYLTPLMGAALIISVPNNLRKQTYTWIMGTTYVIPLLLFLICFVLVYRLVFKDDLKQYQKIIVGILSFMIPLYMENAAAMLCGFWLLVCLYAYFTKNKHLKYMLLCTCISIVGTLIIKFSPGAAMRSEGEHAWFLALSLFEKIRYNWGYFVYYTFMNPNWLILMLSVIMILFTLKSVSGKERIILTALFTWGIIQSAGALVYRYMDMQAMSVFIDIETAGSLALNTAMYSLYTAALFWTVYRFVKEQERKWPMICILFCAGGADLIMLISPIFDARSSIYTVFMFILFALMMLEEIRTEKHTAYVLAAAAVCLGLYYSYHYFFIYRMVNLINQKRMAQLTYYAENPDDKDAYILAYPVDWVHSADVVEGDTYHEEYFKTYYGLQQDVKLNFYYLPEYTEEAILHG